MRKHAKHDEGIASQYAKESQLRAGRRGEPYQLHGARRKVGLGARDDDGRFLGTCYPLDCVWRPCSSGLGRHVSPTET